MRRWANRLGYLHLFSSAGAGEGDIKDQQEERPEEQGGSFTSAIVRPENRSQLAIQHHIRSGDGPRDDFRQYRSIRQFGKRRSASRRFEMF